MNQPAPRLHVVMYHYVRDLPRSAYPAIKGMMLDAFERQVDQLTKAYRMATLTEAVEFLNGTYVPKRDLCLLTFDDGLREHYEQVTPILADRGCQGLFFLITSALAEGRVAPVHMNHFLTAKLGFDRYARYFSSLLREERIAASPAGSDAAAAQKTYPWDTPEVAGFKYLFNFTLDAAARDRLVTRLFEQFIGDQREFAAELYVSWSEAREMQAAGMVLGGHTHNHRPLATLTDADLDEDLRISRTYMQDNLKPQPFWPFCYPYGKRNSFDTRAVTLLKELGFGCAFSTEMGPAVPGEDLFCIRRVDCNRVELPLMAA